MFKQGKSNVSGLECSILRHLSTSLIWLVLFPCLVFLLQAANAATSPNTLITNTVTAQYSIQGTENNYSASVDITTSSKTPSTVTFYRITDLGIPVTLAPTAYDKDPSSSQDWQEVDQVTLLDGTTLSLPTATEIEAANQYIINEPIVIEVTDYDQNIDNMAVDTIYVTVSVNETGDTEVIRLTETSPSSGVFRGVLQTTETSTSNYDGAMTVARNARISVNYRDALDNTDISTTAALIEPVGDISLTKSASTDIASIGETLTYTLAVNTNNFPNGLDDLKIEDRMPPGFRYIPDSAQLNDVSIPSQQLTVNGRLLTFNLGDMPPLTQWRINYRVRISAGTPYKLATNTAQAYAVGEQSFVASASVDIRDELMRDTTFLTGRVYHGCEKDSPVIQNARIYIETGQSTSTDNEGFWHIDGLKPGTHVVTLDTESLDEGLEPVLCQNNTQFAGKPHTQFVDLQAGSLWRADFHVKGQRKHPLKKPIAKDENTDYNPLKDFGDDYATNAKEGFEVLWPPQNYVPPVASINVVVKHSAQQRVNLKLNGKPVDALNYHGSSNNKDKTVRVSRWRGVDIDINDRDNSLEVILTDKAGKVVKKTSRLIHFSSEPAYAEFVEEQSILIADGNNMPELALLVRDKEGFPMRKNTHGYFSIDDGNYQVHEHNADKLEINGKAAEGEYKFYIEEEGIARIRFKPTTQTGEIRLTVKLADGKTEKIRAWIKPHIRDEWIMVGLAEGTVGYNTLSGNMQTLSDLEKDEGLYTHGRIAFFAKGKVKGRYLLTVAYDSAKERGDVGDHLDGIVDPDAWYTIYGDNAQNQYEAQSSGKLFLKLEREQFFMLFGDFRTNMSETELSRYERTLHGVHSEYKGRNYRYNVSLSNTSNKHQRDEIPGDGTSGEYHLSHSIIPSSEIVTLETRDRFHPEKIVSQRLLALHSDYEIDYDSQSLFFKFPIPSRDEYLNPNYIVVSYESESNQKKSLAVSGRVAYLTDDGKTELGVSLIHEKDDNGENADLVGTDITYKLDDQIELKAELAHSRSGNSGNAWLLEAKKETQRLNARAYMRQQDSNFGLEQQNLSEQGTRKFGIEGRYNRDNNTFIRGDAYRQENLDNDNIRDQAILELGKKFSHDEYGQGELAIGLRHTEEVVTNDHRKGTLLTLGGHVSPNDGRVTVRSIIEKNIAGDNRSEAYPDRALVGVDIGLTDSIALFVERELTRDDDGSSKIDRIGLSSKLWDGATLKSSLNRENLYEGDRSFATLGLAQHLNLTEKLSADLSVDHSRTMKDTVVESVDVDQTNINESIRDDYTAFTVGLGWREKDWSWTGRLEHRNGDLEDKDNFRFGLLRELGKGKDISAKIEVTRSQLQSSDEDNTALISMGSAWHPQNSDFTVFQRLDLKHEEEITSGDSKRTRKVVHNMHINKKAGKKTQVSLHHGIKHTFEDEFNNKYNSTIDTAQFQVRRNISERFDIGAHAGYLYDWDTHNREYNYGLSAGGTPAENMWISVGYNFAGYTDEDFDDSEYTAKGPFIHFRYRADKDQLNKIINNKKQ